MANIIKLYFPIYRFCLMTLISKRICFNDVKTVANTKNTYK